MPGIWQAARWATQAGAAGGGISRSRLAWGALRDTFAHGPVLKRWMRVVYELKARGIVRDVPGEYLRALRPSVHRGTTVAERVAQLTDHMDWLETAFHPKAFERLASGAPLVLADLTPPRGYEWMRLQVQRAPSQSPEGEMLLTLTMQRMAEAREKPQPVDASVLAFSRFRIDKVACLAIGGVRGQRNQVMRVSPAEMIQALHGWKASVLLVRVAQELARYWDLQLVGLNPAAHRLQGWSYRWNSRHRETARRIYESYTSLWDHFEAKNGPPGWVIIPLNSDEKLAAMALSPEKRSRQTRRADFWIRTRNLLRLQFKLLLERQRLEPRLSRVTEQMPRTSAAVPLDPDWGDDDDDEIVPSHLLETGPGNLD